MKRLLRYLFWTVLFLLLTLIATIGFAVSTQTGLETLLKTANKVLPGELRYAHLQGQLTGPLLLEDLHYQTPDLEFKLGRLDFEWQPSELLSAKVLLNHLRLDDIEVHLPPPAPPVEEQEAPPPTTLADIQLPIELEIQELTANNIRLFLIRLKNLYSSKKFI